MAKIIREKPIVLIFDLDGTLVDSMAAHARAFSHLINDKFSLDPEKAEKHYLETSGKPLSKQLLSFLEEKLDEEEIATFENEFWDSVLEIPVTLFPDVVPALTFLKEMGGLLCVSSSCIPRVIEQKLKTSNIGGLFSLRLGTLPNSKTLQKGKGHFDIIRKFFSIPRISFTQKAIFVGDSPYDMTIAKEEGILAIGRLSRHVNKRELIRTGADFLVNDLKDLVEILN